MAWIGAAIGAVGGLLSSDDGGQQVQERRLDPRNDARIYGANGNPGLLGYVDNRLKQQLSQGGMNPYQTAGLEMQRQTLLSPQTSGVWDAQRSAGMNLLNQGAAGNPFQMGAVNNNGRVNAGRMPAPMLQQSPAGYYTPQNFSSAFQPVTQSAALPYEPMAVPDIDALVKAAIAQSMAPRPWNPDTDRGSA